MEEFCEPLRVGEHFKAAVLTFLYCSQVCVVHQTPAKKAKKFQATSPTSASPIISLNLRP
jgi:hypothetical protein